MDYFDSRDHLDLIKSENNGPNHFEIKIVNNFIDSTVLITGATGFLGKLLLEKLLRSCYNLKRIFIVIRPKKNKSCDERLDDILKEKIFDNLVAEKGFQNIRSKIVVVPGDCLKENLGFNENIIELLKDQVNFIFHCAAALKMDEFIKTSIFTNVRSTQYLLNLAENMKNLKGFVYMSTAYSHAVEKNIKEIFYDTGLSLKTFSYLINNMSDNEISAITPKILGASANTYSFSKAMSEDIVKSFYGKIPVAIVRPSIVVGCAKEPLVGWTGSLNGPLGVQLAGAIGILHVWFGDYNIRADLIPADVVINATIASAAKIATLHNDKTIDRFPNPVFNIVSHSTAPCNWGDVLNLCEKVTFTDDIYSSTLVGPYSFRFQKNINLFFIQLWLLHLIPGMIYDFILQLFNEEPKLIKHYKKIQKINLSLHYYCLNEWDFEESNVRKLWEELNSDERDDFCFDMSGFSWENHFRLCLRALRVYVLKDPMTTVDKARANFKRIQAMFTAVKYISTFLLLICALNRFNLI